MTNLKKILALLACSLATTSAQTCYGEYDGTIGDEGWLDFINCGETTTPSVNTEWPPTDCPGTPPTPWPRASAYSFPADLDTGFGSKMTKDQVYTILSLVYAVENGGQGTTNGLVPWWKAYSYIQNIGDERGYTTNIVGFCTGTGDVLLFLRHLQKLEPCNPLVQYLPDVEALTNANSASLQGLEGFAHKVLEQAGGPTGSGPINPNYIRATWNTIADPKSAGGYWAIAMERSRRYNLSLPLSKGQMFDIALNSGDLDGVIKRVRTRAPTAAETGGAQERAWLADLQRQWIEIISDPSNLLDGGQNDRGILWQHLLLPTSQAKNSHGQVGATNKVPLLQLELPMTVNCYGSTITIRAP